MATKKPANPVKQADSDAFDLYLLKWQDRLNLNDWRIERSPKPARTSLAEVSSMDLKARLAIYKIGADFGDTKPVTSQSLEEIACHEVLHVLLYELIAFARDPKSQDVDVDSAEHRVIHTLVRLLVPEGD
jgi:hypothetical protein